MQNSPNIALIGMMGSGKTSIGSFLAAKIKKSFYDLDAEIETAYSMKISDIFLRYGEEYFRKIETKKLTTILKNRDNFVLSCGGGTFNAEKNRIFLKKNALTIYLKTDLDILINRVKKSDARPLLNNCNISEKLDIIFKEREKFYNYADIEISTNSSNIELITNNILNKINA
jgi:shikimate kinase